MAKTVDPAFQAAPYLGDSSHDPIEFSRRQNAIKYQRKRERDAEVERSTVRGLDKLTLDLKDLYGERGINEVLEDQARAKEAFMQLQKKGLNVFNPTTPLEIKAYQAISKVQEETMKKVDTITTNKAILESYSKALFEDNKLPEEKRVFNRDTTLANIDAAKKVKGGVLETPGIFDNLLVKNIMPVDVIKDIVANKDFFEKPTIIQTWEQNPETGLNESTSKEELTPEQIKSNAQKAGVLYENKPQSYKDAVSKLRTAETDPMFKLMDDKEYYKTLAVPAYREKYIEKVQSAGGGFKLTLGGSGQEVKVAPQKKQLNNIKLGDQNFPEHYSFNISKPIIGVSVSDIQGAKVLSGGRWIPVEATGGLIDAQLNFYDPKSDTFIFSAKANSMDAETFKGSAIAVPRTALEDSYGELPIIKDDGKPGKLKDIYGKVPEGKRQLPNSFWSAPYIPTKNKK